jgi:hypothetical protein
MRLRVSLHGAMRRARQALAVAAILAAGAGHAATRISVGPLRGAEAPELARDLRRGLCGAFECEPWQRVSSAGVPDLAKARRRGVEGVLTGFIAEPRGGPVLWLYLTASSEAAPARWRFDLNRRRTLDAGALRLLVKSVGAHLAAAASASREPARAPAAPAPAPPAAPSADALGIDLSPGSERPSSPAADPAPRPQPPVVARAAPAAASPPPGAAGTPARASREAGRRWLTLELGVFAVRRELRFEGAGVGAAQLRAYDAKAVAGPEARLEIFPFARSSDGAAAGAGLLASYGRSVGLKTRTDAGEARSSEVSRLSVGATWRSPPLSPLRAVVAPSVSYRSFRAVVEPGISGLANSRLSGVRGGLDVEIGAGRALSLLLGGGYVKWVTAQDLVKGEVAFFPGGSAWAVELEGGIALALVGPMSIRALAEYASTRYALDPDPSGVYSARGARDTYLGGRVLLRASY